MKIVEPYSKVEIEYIASLVGLDNQTVQNKLSEMILDKKFEGTLDQGNGNLIIFEKMEIGNLYQNSLDTLDNMDKVVDKLFEKTSQLKNIE